MLIIIISGSNRILSYDICGKKKKQIVGFYEKTIYIYIHSNNKP